MNAAAVDWNNSSIDDTQRTCNARPYNEMAAEDRPGRDLEGVVLSFTIYLKKVEKLLIWCLTNS